MKISELNRLLDEAPKDPVATLGWIAAMKLVLPHLIEVTKLSESLIKDGNFLTCNGTVVRLMNLFRVIESMNGE